MKAIGEIVAKCISKGIVSVMQVYDLIVNKTTKHLMKQEYVKWRAERIVKQERMHQNQVRQVKIKVLHGTMLKFIKQAVRLFNRHLLLGGGECQIVKKMFKKAGQSPWYG